jgi:hypothetical protein
MSAGRPLEYVTSLPALFTNPYFIAISIPIVFLVSGALAKKIVRRNGWERSDFFLGVEFTLAAMSSQLIYIFDLVDLGTGGSFTISHDLMKKFAATGIFLAFTFLILLFVLGMHQEWERRNNNPRGQIFWLGIVTNLLGAGLLVAFVLLVKAI